MTRPLCAIFLRYFRRAEMEFHEAAIDFVYIRGRQLWITSFIWNVPSLERLLGIAENNEDDIFLL